MRPPPCSGFRGLSWGYAVLRGCMRVGLVRVWVPHPCSAFSALQGFNVRAVLQLAPEATLHGLALLFRARSPGPRAVPASCPAYGTTLSLLDSFCPTTHASWADPFADSESLRRRVPRARFGYLLRGVHHPASRRVKRAGASMGFTLQGLPLIAIGAPLRARAFLALPAAAHHPGGRCEQPGRLQGLLPATSPCCRRNPRVPAVDPFLGFTPPELCSRSSWRAL